MSVPQEVAVKRECKEEKRELIELRDWAPAHADGWIGTGRMR